MPLREAGLGAVFDLPEGDYRELFTGSEQTLGGATAVIGLVEPYGVAVLERV